MALPEVQGCTFSCLGAANVFLVFLEVNSALKKPQNNNNNKNVHVFSYHACPCSFYYSFRIPSCFRLTSKCELVNRLRGRTLKGEEEEIEVGNKRRRDNKKKTEEEADYKR